MTFERGVVEARVTAEVVAAGESLEVAASIHEAADPRRVFLSGRVLLDRAYPEAPAAPEFADPAAVACDWSTGEIYPRRGFHGPVLRAITRVGRHGDAGMTGEITVLPRAPLFASTPRPEFRIDPVVLDALGMGVGIWTWREEMNGVYPVPFRVGRVRFYGPPLPEGETLRMQVAITRNRDGLIAADLHASRRDGAVHVEASDWEDYVYRLPLPVHRIARDPFGQRLAAPVVPAPAGAVWSDIALVELPPFPAGLLAAAEGIWEKILAFYCLAPSEREEWARFAAEPARRLAWLRERAALKDAARSWLAARGRAVGAYDVPIRVSDDGRSVAGAVALAGGSGPALDLALAVASRGERVFAAAADASLGALALRILPAEAPGSGRGAPATGAIKGELRALFDGHPFAITTVRCADAILALARSPGRGVSS
jgi:hypothetical protein